MDERRPRAAAPSAAAADRPDARFETLSLEGMGFDRRYALLTGAVVPRPIALVSSQDGRGNVNVAPFSSFMIASVEAGYLAFSVGPGVRPKTTLVNIRRTREFVINAVSEDMATAVQRCGENAPAPSGRVELGGFSLLPSETVRAPRIAEARVQFECHLVRTVRLGDSHMLIGRIERLHSRAGVVSDGRVDLARLEPLGRLAGRNYCRARDVVTA